MESSHTMTSNQSLWQSHNYTASTTLPLKRDRSSTMRGETRPSSDLGASSSQSLIHPHEKPPTSGPALPSPTSFPESLQHPAHIQSSHPHHPPGHPHHPIDPPPPTRKTANRRPPPIQRPPPIHSPTQLPTAPIMASQGHPQNLSESGITIPSDSENYDANNELSPSPPSSSSSPLILYKPPTLWGLFRGAAINLLLPFVNGLMLGFGELVANEVAFRFGWSGTKVW